MTMEKKRYEFVLEAAQPIAHHAESIGNEAVIMRRKLRTRDGWAQVPIVSADTMRHGMREAAAYAFLDAAGLIGSHLSENALRLLFAGGMVSGKGDGGTVSLDAYRELAELVPPLALFGGCASNRVIPGRLQVDDATLICEETTRYVPTWAIDAHLELYGDPLSRRDHVEEVQRVRMDPTLSPEKRKLLTDGDRQAVEHKMLRSEAGHDAGDHVAISAEKSSMMPRRFERVAQGSLFWWACEARCYSDLEIDTFNVSVATFLHHATVGGKRGTGHGLLRPVAAWNIKLNRPSETIDTIETGLAPRAGELFRAHVAERKERIAKVLAEVDA